MQPTSCKLNVLGVKKVFFSTDGKRRDMAERSWVGVETETQTDWSEHQQQAVIKHWALIDNMYSVTAYPVDLSALQKRLQSEKVADLCWKLIKVTKCPVVKVNCNGSYISRVFMPSTFSEIQSLHKRLWQPCFPLKCIYWTDRERR